MKSQQLLTQSKIFEDEILAGTECTNKPSVDVAEPPGHAQNLTGPSPIELGAKSLILRVYDVLMTDSRYSGDSASRDSAYHQGTVWPWLMGPFITAYIKVSGGSDAARDQAKQWLAPLEEHLFDSGLGHISEIFDGDAPHRPVGCVAQAWSTAEVLRAAVEDVYALRPREKALTATAKAGLSRSRAWRKPGLRELKQP